MKGTISFTLGLILVLGAVGDAEMTLVMVSSVGMTGLLLMLYGVLSLRIND